MANRLKLFLDKRLTPTEPHHLTYIRGRLAAMKVEDPAGYEEYAEFYGTDEVVPVVEELTPVVEEELVKKVEEVKQENKTKKSKAKKS